MEELRASFSRDCMACLRTIRALTSASTTAANRALLRPQLRQQIEDAMGAAVAVTDRVARGSAFEVRLHTLRDESRAALATIVALAASEKGAGAEGAATAAADKTTAALDKAGVAREMRKALVSLTETLRKAKELVAGFDVKALDSQPGDGSRAGSYVPAYCQPQDARRGAVGQYSTPAASAGQYDTPKAEAQYVAPRGTPHYVNLQNRDDLGGAAAGRVPGYVNTGQHAPLYQPHTPSSSSAAAAAAAGGDPVYELEAKTGAIDLYAVPEAQGASGGAHRPAPIYMSKARVGTVVSLEAQHRPARETCGDDDLDEEDSVLPMASDDGLYDQPQEGAAKARSHGAAPKQRSAPVGPPPSDKPPTRPNRL